MLNELKEIREVLEFMRDRTPNFRIETRATNAIDKLDWVIESIERREASAMKEAQMSANYEIRIRGENAN